VFGEKDFQQLAIIRRLAADLGLGAQIAGVPTVRDEDGLALSSRNAYLTYDEREWAVAFPKSLERAVAEIEGGAAVPDALENAGSDIRNAGFSAVDYVALVDSTTLEPLEKPAGTMRLIAAARIGKTRLIDNFPVEVSE